MKLNLLPFVFMFVFSFSLAQDLNVAANGILYVSKASLLYTGANLNVDVNGDAIMDSDSDEFSVLFVNGAYNANAFTGDSEYRRWAASTATRDLLAPAVFGEAFNVFATRNAAVLPAGTIDPPGELLFGPYVPGDGNYTEWAAGATDIITAGVGYRTASNGGATLSFMGDVATGNVGVNIVNSTGQFINANFIGNPYTTYIRAGDLVTAMDASGLFDPTSVAIYGYDGSVTPTTGAGTDSSTWDVINSLTSNYLIAPGQGFFVIANPAGGGTFNFTPAMRRASGGNDDFLVGRIVNPFNILAQFKVALVNPAADLYNDTEFYFLDNGMTRGVDVSWDAAELNFPTISISSLLDDDSGSTKEYQIQTLDIADLTDFSDELVIPLHLKAAANQNYVIKLLDFSLPAGVDIYLHDTLFDTFTALNETEYSFTPSTTLYGTGRFYLRTTTNSLNVVDLNFNNIAIKSINGQKTLKVLGALNSESQLSIYDITGRKVNSFNIDSIGLNEHTFNVASLSSGPYIVTLKDAEGRTKEAKVIIN